MNGFIAYAFKNSAIGNKILCPCRKCANIFWREACDVREHLCDGFLRGYTTWNLHGETSSSDVNPRNSDGAIPIEEAEEDEVSELLRDLAGGLDDGVDFEDENSDVQPSDDLRAL